MKSLRLLAPLAVLCALAPAIYRLAAAQPGAAPHDGASFNVALWEHRNLGKAFYENPDTHLQAVDQLKAAFDLDPNSVRDRVNYALALLRAGQTDTAIAQLLTAQKSDPSLPHTWFNLGITYKRAAEYDKAIEQFRGMIKLVPDEPKTHYNLAAVLRAQGHNDDALAEFLTAERLGPDLAGPHFQLFTLYQRAGNKTDAASQRRLFEEIKKNNEGAAVPEDMEWSFYAELYDPPDIRPSASSEPTHYDDHTIATGFDPASSGLLTIDSTGAGQSDLLAWSHDRVSLFLHGSGLAKSSGLESIHNIIDIAAGDFDNDGLADLCILSDTAATLYRNNKGTFAKYAELPNTAGARKALWLDYDHDYDLDLFLFGPNSALLRNNGNGKFEDHTADFPFVKGRAIDAVTFALRSDTAVRDLIVSYADQVGTLYTDKLNGVFEASSLPPLSGGASALDAQDFDHDGLLDIVSYRPEVFAIRNNSGKLELASHAHPPVSPVRADFNGDGREDYARLLPDGSLHLFTNASPAQHWLAVRLEGIKNIKEAVDATVEMKSGAYYEKRIYTGVPLAFALDGRAEADTVRITWPNGLIQNETNKKSTAPTALAKTVAPLAIPEAQRLSGSCPMIFAWNGLSFEFVTDVLGVAPLGASSGDGHYFPVDHDEYIQIPGRALSPVDGNYRIHITEELHEVSYLDQVQLIALDHPAQTQIFTNDKFKSPPYPEFRLYGSAAPIHPVRAIENDGTSSRADATARVLRRDRTYPDSFPRDPAGAAALHTLDLDFGNTAASNRAALVLNGWVDWADGSTFLGASQDPVRALTFPYLQVKNARGEWQTVVSDMGLPSGKPKTITVDLTGKFLSASRQVRIVTNLCIYWDEIFLIDDARPPQVRLTPVDASAAALHFRGFSQAIIDPARRQPEQFLYDQVRPVSNWNPTPGLYTRYGDVQPLTTRADDRLVIMGSGDELNLEFPATSLPALPSGWTRDFLLLVDGWAKDADANTAFSQSVAPLPFHAMSAYPYQSQEHFPADPLHAAYLRDYLTRPALRLIRPLAPTSTKPAE